MTITVDEATSKLIEMKMQDGRFQSVQELLRKAFISLDREEAPWLGDFDADELNKMLDEGLASGPLVPADDVFAELEAKSRELRGQKPNQ